MKKNLILLFFSIIVFTQVKATDWFPIGAKWTWDYRLCCTGDYYTDKWNLEKDTVIGVDTFNVLNQFVRHLNENKRIIIKENNQKIYRWFNNKILPICDFSKLEKDTSFIVLPNDLGKLDSFLYIIDSIRTLQQMPALRVQFGRFTPFHNTNISFPYPKVIIEKTIFFGFENSYNFLITEPPIPHLRCYQDNEFIINLTSVACDSTIDKVKETFNANLSIKVFPNPVLDKIQVEFSNINKYKDLKLFLVDLNGKIIKSIENNLEMDVYDVSTGLYYLKILCNEEFVTKQIIINH
ncbi:MAG TPA: T9SS type A sorting domain-containing protein [Chitinophagales bacterium]|nr:T9SS type A sorting domain-containing protein [Chitinophagales bacterium]